MESQSDENDDYVPSYNRPSKGNRLKRSINARLQRKRTKRIRALIKQREDRKSENFLKSIYRKTRTRLQY